ncbi:MAG: MBL fold metallo-hydrolase [Gammaproteobacteria bacterium]|nr:MBL fold metallo-hydrolase [Gammaproteobacteria bacterium]
MVEERQSPGSFRLSNDGELTIFFVGCGSAFSRTMNQNNLLVIKGDQHLLVDCGTKSPQALHELLIEPSEIENFLITHTHADHIGGLEEVMMVNRYLTEKKPNIIINEDFEEILWNQSLRGGSAHSEENDGQPLSFTDFWQTIRPTRATDTKRETWETRLGNLDIKMPRTKHFPDNAKSWQDSFWSCGVLFDERVLFTSDTRLDLDLLVEFDERYNLEIIFHDCQFFTGGVHASLDELATLPDSLKCKMVLMHYGDNWLQYKDQVQAAGFHSFAKQNHSYTFK